MKNYLSGNSAIKAHTRGILYALILTLCAVLVFAFMIKAMNLPSTAIKPTVQIIKVLSIFFGVFIILKSIQKNAWLHGAVLGLIYTMFAFLIFSIIDNNFSLTSGLFIDSIFALAVGAISAMLIRFRKKEF